MLDIAWKIKMIWLGEKLWFLLSNFFFFGIYVELGICHLCVYGCFTKTSQANAISRST